MEIKIVQALPTQEISEIEIEGKKVQLITFEEAIREILETVREIKKTVG